MPTFKTVALSLAAVLISGVSVQAAPHKKPVHHTAPHAMRHSTAAHSASATRGGAPNADHSADMLNAQSLSRSQSPTP